jgi:hypothetical protein
MNSRYIRPSTATTSTPSYKHQLLLATSFKPKKKPPRDDMLFKQLAIEIIPGINFITN